MSEVTIIGIDLAKHVFQLHGAAADGKVLCRRRVRREKLLAFLASQPACDVVMEACGSAHYWAREIGGLGHRVQLIAPAYVKPFSSGRRTTRRMPKPSSRRRSGRRCASWR